MNKSFLLTQKLLVGTALTLMGFSLIACQMKVTSTTPSGAGQFGNEVPNSKVNTEGAWASQCNLNSMFSWHEITVIEFKGAEVKYDNYRYSDAACTQLTYEDHKVGEFSIGAENGDHSYDIDYAMDIGSGARQLFFDVIKRENDQLFFGNSLAPGEEYRSATINVNYPYHQVSSNYRPGVDQL